jgi:(2Fe-2S) ferredoxin
MTQHYAHHVFICLNQRDNGEACCADHHPKAMHKHMKMRCKELNLNGAGKVRINQAGCLDRCEHGPVMVVYPEGTWYNFVDEHDIDEIVESHLQNNQIVDRLLVK